MPQSKKQKGTRLLIDADTAVYVACDSEQRIYEWDDETTSVVMGTLEQAIEKFDAAIERIKEKTHIEDVIFAVTDNDNFRKRILPTYKANRKAKPVLLYELREYLVKERGAYQKPGLEGDDVIGILATHPRLIPGDKIVVSIDKDLKQIPGTLYNPDKDTYTVVTKEEADYFHFFQTLVGDPTDEYKGCPGIGPVKAAKVLEADDPWQAIVSAFVARGLTGDDALVQARVARILRHTDYDYKRKEPILWNPSH